MFSCGCFQVKEEASQGRSSDTLHLDSSGLVTLTTPNRLATVGVRAIPLPQGKTQARSERAERLRAGRVPRLRAKVFVALGL